VKQKRKRRFAVLIFMERDKACVDAWHTRERAIECLREYRSDAKWAKYLDGMVVVERDETAK
jgi:hypothetical protein